MRQYTLFIALAVFIIPSPGAFALITGGEGNDPISDPGWPAGAAAIFNNPTRIAWWEGPPFGGGQWHAEYRGDAAVFNEVLAAFAKLDVKIKRLVVHDGVGHSFWLNPNNEPEKRTDAEIDWMFVVWQAESFERLRKMPADLQPRDIAEAGAGPPAELHVYIGDNIRWSDVKIPDGIEVVDNRMEAHGFTPADGTVLEGTVTDLATKLPIAARMRLELIAPQSEGGYRYTVAAEAAADAKGHWLVKNAPAGWYRVIIDADGYVPRVVGHAKFDEQPRWQRYDGGLARPASVSGRVSDDAGQPLAEVDVRLGDVAAGDDGSYDSPDEFRIKTGADGRFEFTQVPIGTARVWINKTGYCRPGLGPTISTPTKDLELTMLKSAQLRVTVDFTGTERPGDYMVNLEPEGGSTIGSWGGSGSINAENVTKFSDVPPGRYVIHGHPNPHSENEATEPVTVELKGGETTEITLKAN
ncbi:MAG TPA: carboxypeptidase-like regulatory domain-containing protein [Lacipirellulaceae bacterium]|nr:carboxypeptidase-like regulatory domain-containing protein [Lacipirellulaceae bacterium]